MTEWAAMISEIPPSVVLAVGALLIPALPGSFRSAWFIALPLLGLALLWSLPTQLAEACVVSMRYGGLPLMPYVSDPLSRVFASAFLVVVATGGVYAWHNRDAGEKMGTLFYAAGALGVVLAGDYLTLFVFWELMALSSTWLVWSRRDAESGSAGLRYLLYHVLGGGLLLAGILLEVTHTGSIQIQPFETSGAGGLAGLLTSPGHPGAWLVLLGVAVNAAIPPLHTWLPDAYPKATVTGAVFMSALTTKSAIYVLIRLFPGWEVLVWLGLAMALYGTIWGLMSDSIRQIFAYSILAQLGYMVTAIGTGLDLALNGAAAHAFSHILYKSLLFMAGGALIYSVGTDRLSKLGGLWAGAAGGGARWSRQNRFMFGATMVGALSISGLPLLNGFISKPMIIQAVGEAHYEAGMLVLIVASVGTFLHTGLKIPYYTWFAPASAHASTPPPADLAKPHPTAPRALPGNMLAAMGIGSALCIVFGLAPGWLYALLPHAMDYKPFKAYPIAESLLVLGGGFLIFRAAVSRFDLRRAGELLDLDAPFRALMPWVRKVFVEVPWAVFEAADRVLASITRAVVGLLRNPLQWLQPFGDGAGTRDGRPAHHAESFTPAIEIVMALVLFTFLALGVGILF